MSELKSNNKFDTKHDASDDSHDVSMRVCIGPQSSGIWAVHVVPIFELMYLERMVAIMI